MWTVWHAARPRLSHGIIRRECGMARLLVVSSCPFPLYHATDLLLVGILLQACVEVLPPLKQHRVADELEPGGELEGRVLELLLQLLRADILGRLNFIDVGVEVNVGFDKQDIID